MTGSERVRTAFGSVRREDFLPSRLRRLAREDKPVRIGHGQTNSQPTTVRNMLELLDVEPGHRVLDVGCGSAWTTALLGVLVGPAGRVDGVELLPALVAWGRANLAAYPMAWVEVAQAAPGVLGLPARAPYDRILVSAQASSLPRSLVDQLEVGGVLVIPVAGRMTVVRRGDAGPQVSHHGRYAFVPLVEPGTS